MKKLFEDSFVYENLLLTYYAEEQQTLKILSNGNLHIVIDRFLEILDAEDKQRGTNHVKLIREIYSNPKFEDRTEFFKTLHISNSTLQRYREKYCSTLKLVLERFVNNVADISLKS